MGARANGHGGARTEPRGRTSTGTVTQGRRGGWGRAGDGSGPSEPAQEARPAAGGSREAAVGARSTAGPREAERAIEEGQSMSGSQRKWEGASGGEHELGRVGVGTLRRSSA